MDIEIMDEMHIQKIPKTDFVLLFEENIECNRSENIGWKMKQHHKKQQSHWKIPEYLQQWFQWNIYK